MIILGVHLGERARQKYNEFTSVIQPTRSESPQQKKAKLFKQIMQEFDMTDVETSMLSLLLAAGEVENMNTDHPPGYYTRATSVANATNTTHS